MALDPEDSPHVIFSLHAIQRMFERRIGVDDVLSVLQHGLTIEQYPDDVPYPSRLIVGWRDKRALHVVVAEDSASAMTIVVTVYEPERSRWDSSFRQRRG